jgi:hypothetical protein
MDKTPPRVPLSDSTTGRRDGAVASHVPRPSEVCSSTAALPSIGGSYVRIVPGMLKTVLMTTVLLDCTFQNRRLPEVKSRMFASVPTLCSTNAVGNRSAAPRLLIAQNKATLFVIVKSPLHL